MKTFFISIAMLASCTLFAQRNKAKYWIESNVDSMALTVMKIKGKPGNVKYKLRDEFGIKYTMKCKCINRRSIGETVLVARKDVYGEYYSW